jgi:phage terminase small subunit
MARLPKQNMTPGLPAKPPKLPKDVSAEWDRLVSDLVESNISVAKAHGRLIEQAARIAVDIEDATEVVKDKGAYYLNKNTGAYLIHPATRRLDSLRRDYVKVLSLLGLRSVVAAAPETGQQSVEDMLDEE